MSRGKVFAGTSYVDAAQLEEWFARAPAGAKAIYAVGPVIDPKHPVMALVREWRRMGEVLDLPQVRVEGGFSHSFQRCHPAPRVLADEQGARRARVVVDDDWRETKEGRVFLMLVRAANLGLPCPSNTQLAEANGLRDADAARYCVDVLERDGRIERKLSGAGRSHRRIRIVETGKWTADEPGSVPLPGFDGADRKGAA